MIIVLFYKLVLIVLFFYIICQTLFFHIFLLRIYFFTDILNLSYSFIQHIRGDFVETDNRWNFTLSRILWFYTHCWRQRYFQPNHIVRHPGLRIWQDIEKEIHEIELYPQSAYLVQSAIRKRRSRLSDWCYTPFASPQLQRACYKKCI